MGSEQVSYAAIGALCGASRQAVWKSKDPLRWLEARARRFLVPGRPESLRGAAAAARAAVGEMVAAARRRVGEMPAWSGRGRRVAREPAALADLLGVVVGSGDDLAAVFGRWLLGKVEELERAGEVSGAAAWLDARWLPRWVRRQVGRWPVSKAAPASKAAPKPKPKIDYAAVAARLLEGMEKPRRKPEPDEWEDWEG